MIFVRNKTSNTEIGRAKTGWGTAENGFASPISRDKKGWTQRVGLANVSPKGLYHGIRGWFKLDSGS